jgi:heat shock protein HspQ
MGTGNRAVRSKSARLADGRRLAKPPIRAIRQFPSGTLVSPPHKNYIACMERSSFFSPQAGRLVDTPRASRARFAIGDVVRHKLHDFRGVVFDIDPVFANSDEWYESIPMELRPLREQPYYHLFAENDESSYIAYVSQQNLVEDGPGGPIEHPQLDHLFDEFDGGRYPLRRGLSH